MSINVEGEFESIVLEIQSKYNKPNIIVSEIYRIPNTNERLSIERFEHIVTALSNSKCDIIIGSDQNIDYKNVNKNKNASDLLDAFFASGILPTIKRPTRITHTSATIIDNLYVKCNGYNNVDSRISLLNISDHFPIISCMGKTAATSCKTPRPIDLTQIDNITKNLNSTNWETFFNGNVDVSESYDNFIEHFSKILDEHAPLRKAVIPASYVIRESWMTTDLLKASRKLDILYRKSIGKSKSDTIHSKYFKYRNIHNKNKRDTKIQHYDKLLSKYNTNIRPILNNITGRLRDKTGISDTFVVNGEQISDKNLIANHFCSYFTNIGKTYASSIPKSDKLFNT